MSRKKQDPSTTSTTSTTSITSLKPAPVFDLAEAQMQDSAIITVTHPVREELQAHITIASIRSKLAKAAQRANPVKMVDGKVSLKDEDQADFEGKLTEQLIAVTLAWDLWENGAPLPCTPENVRRVYTEPATAWIGVAVQAGYVDLSRFFAKPSGS